MGNLDPATSPYRGCSGPVGGCAPRSFALRLPEGNLFGIDAGRYRPAVAGRLLPAPRPAQARRAHGDVGGHGNLGTPFVVEITYRLLVTRR